MGTRGFLGFVVDDVEKIAYNHFDSYPSGLGADVRAWLISCDLEEVRAQAKALRVVDEDSEPTDEDLAQLSQYLDPYVDSSRNGRPSWYQLLRKTQGKPGEMLDAGVVEDAHNFPGDSLFAEWGYVVDLDANTFEVYKGFQQAPHEDGRFATMPGRNGFYPVRLVKSWPLYALPAREEDFIEAVSPEGDDD